MSLYSAFNDEWLILFTYNSYIAISVSDNCEKGYSSFSFFYHAVVGINEDYNLSDQKIWYQ